MVVGQVGLSGNSYQNTICYKIIPQKNKNIVRTMISCHTIWLLHIILTSSNIRLSVGKKYLFLPLMIQLGVRPFSRFRTQKKKNSPHTEHVKPRNDPVTSNWNISSTVSQRARFSNGTSTTRGIASMAGICKGRINLHLKGLELGCGPLPSNMWQIKV